jgi:hypothetical protein
MLSTKVTASAAANGLERDVFKNGKFVIADPTPPHRANAKSRGGYRSGASEVNAAETEACEQRRCCCSITG